MTVLTKPSLLIGKSDLSKTPLVSEESHCPEEKVVICSPPLYDETFPPPIGWEHPKHSSNAQVKYSYGALFCMYVVALLVLITGMLCCMSYYQAERSTGSIRFKCIIPVNREEPHLIEPNYYQPLSWTSDPDVQIIEPQTRDDVDNNVDNVVDHVDNSVEDLNNTEDNIQPMKEMWDIGNNYEKITVVINGRSNSYVHDFNSNTSGIVDSDRCFKMDMDPEHLLQPHLILAMIHSNSQFDLTPVRNIMSAVLPALRETNGMLGDLCNSKPVYQLVTDQKIIRKRSVEMPDADYVQFAGKQVQEIKIANLEDVIKYEENNKA